MEISKTKISLLSSLQTKKMREKYKLFIAEGEKCVRDTLGAFPLEYLVATQSWLERSEDIPRDAIVMTASERAMEKISSFSNPPEVLAVFRMPDNDNEIPILNEGLYLLLDGIQDPGNLGTIVRTADWFGFHTIYASYSTVSIYNPKAVQGTMGSLKRVKVIYTDLVSLLEHSCVENVYGTLLDGKDIFKTELSRNGVIIMGNEGKGLSEEIRRFVNHPLFIPPWSAFDHGESLNVSIAAAITMAQFRGAR